MINDDKGNAHIMCVSYLQKLIGLVLCPICKSQSFRAKSSHLKRNSESHMKKCKETDGKIVNKVIFQKIPKLIVPHIPKNKTYRLLLANRREKEFKPTQFYITYSIMSMNNLIHKDFGEYSQQLSTLDPLCIASTIKSKKGNKTIYFDIWTKNFLNIWMKTLIEEEKQVKNDNCYDDDTIPQCYEVPVL
ncbi:MAG: hypothetical protein EZS28_021205 [Streblomastix strix]|uniref:Uncharacterized protein n=1 Tax=Streblomastix strix TaxID=222440 RepID=A0A5J4VLA6_9EUKA|nr:MAG: hypothetical protein EZS28_021205 [Streblomastix strix]